MAASNLSALSGKIKRVLSSFPKWDLQPIEDSRQRADSRYEERKRQLVIGKAEQCQPTVIVPQQELSDDSASSHSESSDSDLDDLVSPTKPHDAEQPSTVTPMIDPLTALAHKLPPPPKKLQESSSEDPLQENPLKEAPPKDNPLKGTPSQVDPLKETPPRGNPPKENPPVKKPEPTKPAAVAAPPPPAEDVPKPILQDNVSGKAPILLTRSEDASNARRAVAKEAAKTPVPEHKANKACQGCTLS